MRTRICWIKDDSKKEISCSKSSALGFWSIYLLARGPSFFQPLLKLSPHALGCSLSTAYLKKVLPSFTLFRSKGTLSVYKAPLFPPVSQHLCLTNLPSRVKGLGPKSSGSPGTRVALELFCTENYKIMPEFPIPRKSCLVWWYRPTDISGRRSLNPESLRDSAWPPVLDLHCGEERNKRHKNVS